MRQKGMAPKLVSGSAGTHSSLSVWLPGTCSCLHSWISLGRNASAVPQPWAHVGLLCTKMQWHRPPPPPQIPQPPHLLPPLWWPQGALVSICLYIPEGVWLPRVKRIMPNQSLGQVAASLKLPLARQEVRVRKQAASLREYLPSVGSAFAESNLCTRPREAPGPISTLKSFSILPQSRSSISEIPGYISEVPQKLLKLFFIPLSTVGMCISPPKQCPYFPICFLNSLIKALSQCL